MGRPELPVHWPPLPYALVLASTAEFFLRAKIAARATASPPLTSRHDGVAEPGSHRGVFNHLSGSGAGVVTAA
jgi:hypothetical protein